MFPPGHGKFLGHNVHSHMVFCAFLVTHWVTAGGTKEGAIGDRHAAKAYLWVVVYYGIRQEQTWWSFFRCIQQVHTGRLFLPTIVIITGVVSWLGPTTKGSSSMTTCPFRCFTKRCTKSASKIFLIVGKSCPPPPQRECHAKPPNNSLHLQLGKPWMYTCASENYV